MHPATVVALDIGGSSVKSGRVVNGAPDGGVVVTPLVRDAPADALVESLASAVRVVAPPDAYVVAAAVPDPFDHAAGVSWMTHKFGALLGRPLAPLLARALGQTVDVRWCNDAAAAVAGEALAGAGAGHRVVLGVTLGTGLGAALVSGGTVVERAGDIVVGDLWQQSLPDGRSADTAFAARTLLAGDPVAFAADLAAFLAPVALAAGADVVVVGGGGAGSFDEIAPGLRAALAIPVERARLGPWAALVGAASLCWPPTVVE